MDKEYFPVLIALVGPLLGFGFSWLLQLFSHRQRIKEANLDRLRERQAEVVAKLSNAFYGVETTWCRLQDVDLVDDSEKKVIIKELLESEKRLRDDFNQNRLWIDEALCEEIDAIFPKLRDAVRNYKQGLRITVGGLGSMVKVTASAAPCPSGSPPLCSYLIPDLTPDQEFCR